MSRRKADLADVLGVSRSRISEIVKRRRHISIRELPLLSRFLELPVSEIVRRETGDAGYRGEEAGAGPGSNRLEDSALGVYSATKETLGAFTRHGLDDMTEAEIEIYARVIAWCATRSHPAGREQHRMRAP